MNRIILDMNCMGGINVENATKIAGLVTFGSPLDKITFYFGEQTREEEYVRKQILNHLHGFKSHMFPEEEHPALIESPIASELERVIWLNFYHDQDFISGPLDAYQVDENVICDVSVSSPSEAHSVYWNYDPMYRAIGAAFFTENGTRNSV